MISGWSIKRLLMYSGLVIIGIGGLVLGVGIPRENERRLEDQFQGEALIKEREKEANEKNRRIFGAARSRGLSACQEFLEDSPANEFMFKKCVMWTAFHRKNPADCESLKQFNVEGRTESKAAATYYRCIGVVAARSSDVEICREYLSEEDSKKCIDYSKREPDVNLWNRTWEFNLQF